MKGIVSIFLVLSILCLTGCYQAHSDDSLRTVPSTNNPHLIQDSIKGGTVLPGLGY